MDASEQKQAPREEEMRVTFMGTLNGFRVNISKQDNISEVIRRGYGDEDGDSVSLRMYEAMHMFRQGWLSVMDKNGNPVDFGVLVSRCLAEDKRGWTKFLVYRDLRARGYVVREGFNIRSDLRLYARGDYPGSAARFVVIPINEGERVKLSDLQGMIETVYRLGKEAIVAVVERRGEIIYYRASKMNFEKN